MSFLFYFSGKCQSYLEATIQVCTAMFHKKILNIVAYKSIYIYMIFFKKYNWTREKMWVERQLADSDFANCFNVCGCVFELSEKGTCLWVALIFSFLRSKHVLGSRAFPRRITSPRLRQCIVGDKGVKRPKRGSQERDKGS